MADDERRKLFELLDVSKKGKVSQQEFSSVLTDMDHPLKSNPKLISAFFSKIDFDKDNYIDFVDFQSYIKQTDSQIKQGFSNIDSDKDGRLSKQDFQKYLQKLNLSPNSKEVDSFFQQINKKNDEYITFDEFRNFLILIPRLNGSRIKTAFQYLVEELDLSSDGDVTLINQFLNGVGFFLAGGLSGVVSRTVTAPFDRIKVFLIARTDLSSIILHSKSDISKQSANKNHHTVALEKIKSPLVKAATTLWRQGGIRAFYVGNGLNVLKVFPESAMKFGSFETAKKFFAQIEGTSPSNLSKSSTYLAGGFGGVVAQFTVYPIDTLKYRVQCSKLDSELKGNRLLIQTAKDMYKQGGLKIFYRGWFVGISGIFPYAALDLGTFTSIKKWYLAKYSSPTSLYSTTLRVNGTPSSSDRVSAASEKLPNHIVLTMGALSGTIGATAVYPINLLRTRLQAQGTFAHPYTYNGFFDVLGKTVKREGYPGLFKGLVPNLAKVAPAVGVSYLMYENLKVLFGLQV